MIDFLIYFMKKWIVFMQNRFVCNPGFEHRFLPEMFSTILGVIELQMTFMIACWKALYVYFHFLKYHIFLMGILRVIEF